MQKESGGPMETPFELNLNGVEMEVSIHTKKRNGGQSLQTAI
jgi:hypothetical protein